MPKRPKTLTLKLDLQTLAEFNVAARIFRARSVASFLHEYVVRQINDAKHMVSVDAFNSMVESEKKHILERSAAKAQSYRSVAEERRLAKIRDEVIKNLDET